MPSLLKRLQTEKPRNPGPSHRRSNLHQRRTHRNCNCYQAVAGSSLSFVLSGTDPDHAEAELAYEVLVEPSQGVYNFSGRASVSYTPNANTETDTLVFRAVDPLGEPSENATITINVTTLNSNPSASDAEMTITEDSANNETELTLTDPDDDQIFVVELVTHRRTERLLFSRI